MRNMPTARALAVAALCVLIVAPVLSGCVRVSTVITPRGFVQRTFTVTVEAANRNAVLQRVREVFRGWDIQVKEHDARVSLTCKSTRDADTPADYQGMTLDMQSEGSERVYRYSEKIDVLPYLGGKESVATFRDAPIEYRVTMPGEITRHSALVTLDGDDTVVVKATVGEINGRTIRVESAAHRTDHAFLMAMIVVLAGGAVLSFVSSDAPRKIRDRFAGDDGDV